MSNQNEQKIYINDVFLNEVVFSDGGSIIKVSISADKIESFANQLKANASNGYVNLKIAKNRQPVISKKNGRIIATHSLSVDNWKPKQSGGTSLKHTSPNEKPEPPDDDQKVPF